MSIQHCIPNCRCFRFKTNCWSTNMCCSRMQTRDEMRPPCDGSC